MVITKKLFLVFLSLICITGYSQKRRTHSKKPGTAASYKAGSFIDVNTASYPQSAYSITDLISKVLISGGSECAGPSVTNVKVSPNTAATNGNRSWGYFNAGTTNFPFSEGIILSTGYAKNAGNTKIDYNLGDNIGNQGDTDLDTAINPSQPLTNATYIEFDFVPFVEELTFNFLFASEEYTSSYPCDYSDGFALLLKKQGDANYTNLAVLPNGAGPVSVTNIVPKPPYSCGPINAQYFGGHNTEEIETNFNGRVVPLKARTNVTPGVSYHFKMVLADAGDDDFDSAVFIDAGSFNIGVQIQDEAGVDLGSDYTLCGNDTVTLTASTSVSNPVFKWYKDGNLLPGVSGNTYTVTTPGKYKVEVYIATSSCPIGEKEININAGHVPVAQDSGLGVCTEESSATFNLEDAKPKICTETGVKFQFYEKESDAYAGNLNIIPNPTSYTTSTKTIYVRVSLKDCFVVVKLDLTVAPFAAAPIILADHTALCEGGSIVLTSNQDNGNIWSTGETTKSITVTQAGTYTLKYNNGACDSESTSITITNQPDINLMITGDLLFCEGGNTILTSSSPTGNVWSTGETTQSITVSTPGNYSVTVTTPSGCQFKKTVKVTQTDINIVIKTPDILTCSRTQVTLDATGTNYQDGDIIIWQASNGGHIVSGGDTLTPVVDTTGTYTITVTRGKCSESATVVVTEDKTIPVISVTADRLTICEGESVTLKASGGVRYNWEGFPDNQTANQIVSPTETTTYTVSGIGANGCPSLPATIIITVVPAITSTLEGGKICEGDPITLNAGSGPNYTYVWSTGETSQTITVNHIAEYSVTISNGICSETFTVQVEQAEIPEITEVIYNHPQLTIIATNPQNTILEYSIDGGVTWQISNVFDNIAKNQSYDLAVRSQNTSCSSSGKYFTFSLSNVITPDGDGYNDIIDFSGISGYQNFSARIYDRYGNEVYKADSNKKYWDGTAGSRKLSTGSYWYVIIWDDPFTKITNRKTGWIMLNLR